MQAGDKNTTYFHRQCRARLSRNHISEISLGDGVVIKGQDPLKQAAWTHFQLLFHEDGLAASDVSVEFLDKIPTLVNPEDNQALLKPFSEQEILDVIWVMEPDKAPGSDGFSFHFYRVCWNIIKSNMIRMVLSFHKKSKFGGCTNSTFLALIPKEVNPSSFDRFRPIYLCNASYKILSKLLAKRIKPLLGKLISPLQGGFVKGRHLIDNVIQVQEAIHSSSQWKEKGMLIKLDMQNAFDRIKLPFLYDVLLTFGFRVEFVNLIKACNDMPWIDLLVNGRPSDFFQGTHGL